ncbi:S8 family peptidase [Clostridium hydrogenum]|uniref:S8 family peptidase n=1 Tax=Clostridium hydrogenum TaxID=2855764 RepID=UPI001F308BC0|nr:S8 family peptidase [Clostridium hydrogenum]
MSNENYFAKKVLFRSKDKMSGRVPSQIPGPSRWRLTEKKAIVRHLNLLLKSAVDLLNNEISVKSKIITNSKNFPIPMTIKMHDKMIAKSHRPVTILSEIDSNIISVQELGKLVAGISEYGLESLIEIIEEVIPLVPNNIDEWTYYKTGRDGQLHLAIKSKFEREYNLIHELTSIKNFYAYSDEDILKSVGERQLSIAKNDGKIKVRFFNYDDSDIDNKIMASFIKKFSEAGIKRSTISKLNLSGHLNTYLIPYNANTPLQEIAHFPGVEQISVLNRLTSTSNKNFNVQSGVDIIEPKDNVKYPKIALVDSGISKDNKYLEKWVTERVEFVDSDDQDNYHGDFIGGSLVYGGILNPNLQKCIESGVKVLDVVVIPNEKKSILREDELINSLIDALEDYSDKYKIWNLSLNVDEPICGIISDFTAAIDELQSMYDVIFVISSGNYSDMRSEWPIQDIFEDESDRITSPADSVRGITVGAVAIDSNEFTLVDKNVVTPYSRKGPGIGLTIKPDVVHYSGNPDEFPIRSIDKNGNMIKEYGTSFSTPFVSAILAEYFNDYPNNLSNCLAKALLIHGARNPINNKTINSIRDHYYYGFGIPTKLDDFLYGNENEITLIFEGNVNASEGANWIKVTDFPYPDSLCSGNKIRGEVLVTLAYDPHLNPNLGSEYCRSNLDLRLRSEIEGTYQTISKASSTKDTLAEEKWEKTRMTKELKWSPIKQVKFSSPQGRMGSKNIDLEIFPTWRNLSEKQKINFAIVVTIKDPKGEAPVYNEVSKLLLSSFQCEDIVLNNVPNRIINR